MEGTDISTGQVARYGCLGVAAVVIFAAFTLFLSIGGQAIRVGVQPWFIHQQTENVRASNGYITSHQQELMQMLAQYNDLEVKRQQSVAQPDLASALYAQEATLHQQMTQEAVLIPQDVPAAVQSFLATGGR